MTSSIPRFLLPKGPSLPSRSVHAFRRSTFKSQRTIQPCRHVTGSASAKPGAPPPKNVLGKPDKFRPPSHSSRPRTENPFGAELTEAQKTRKYPHIPGANPEEGTFMYWFLSNDDLHLFITLGTLFTLAGIAWYENYRRDTAFRDSLPTREEWLSDPLQTWKDFIWLWKLSAWEQSLDANAIRTDAVDDVQKRNSWRKYHGIEDKQSIGPWQPTEEVLKEWEEKKRLRGEVTPKRPRPKWIFGISWGD